jgi:hypothetical protein
VAHRWFRCRRHEQFWTLFPLIKGRINRWANVTPGKNRFMGLYNSPCRGATSVRVKGGFPLSICANSPTAPSSHKKRAPVIDHRGPFDILRADQGVGSTKGTSIRSITGATSAWKKSEYSRMISLRLSISLFRDAGSLTVPNEGPVSPALSALAPKPS